MYWLVTKKCFVLTYLFQIGYFCENSKDVALRESIQLPIEIQELYIYNKRCYGGTLT